MFAVKVAALVPADKTASEEVEALLEDRVLAEPVLLEQVEVELEELPGLEVGANGPAVAVGSLD